MTNLDLEPLAAELTALATRFARSADADGPRSPAEAADLGVDDDAAAYLTRVKVLAAIAELATSDMERDVGAALERGAAPGDVGSALGITRQAVEQRWGWLGRGSGRVAVVISRRDRVHQDLDDDRRRYGEVGGTDQYDSDRRAWPIGAAVRELARYAIVAVDGTVRRIYVLDPAGWQRVGPKKWAFTAVGGRAATSDEIDAAYVAGDLPMRLKDKCPTRAGGAYRPHWF